MGRDLSLEDLMENPEMFGLPTFEQFAANRDYYIKSWKMHDEATFESADEGSVAFKKNTKEHVYHYGVYNSKKLYDIVKIVKNSGVNFKDLGYAVQEERTTAGKSIFHIKFYEKGKLGG